MVSAFRPFGLMGFEYGGSLFIQPFFLIWLLLFSFIIIKNVRQYIENENSPVLTVSATIVDKRRRSHHHQNHHTHSYHITFETQDGEILELRVKRSEYYELEIGDRGLLTHQGTRYHGFER